MATITRYASANAIVSGSWGTPEEMYSDNAAYATCATGKNASYFLDISGFGFDNLIPSGATIDSVTLEVKWKVSVAATNGAILGAQCYTGGSVIGSELLNSSRPTNDTVESTVNTGITTRDQLLDANFKVRVRAQRGSSSTAVICSYDYVRITVVYTEPSTPSGETLFFFPWQLNIVPANDSIPVITIKSVTKTKLSDEPGFTTCTVTFQSNVDILEWEARAGGTGQGLGILVGSGTTVLAGVDTSFDITYDELISGDGAYRINIYGRNAAGWTAYE